MIYLEYISDFKEGIPKKLKGFATISGSIFVKKLTERLTSTIGVITLFTVQKNNPKNVTQVFIFRS